MQTKYLLIYFYLKTIWISTEIVFNDQKTQLRKTPAPTLNTTKEQQLNANVRLVESCSIWKNEKSIQETCELRSLRLFGSIRVGFVSVVDNDVINVMLW